MQPENTCPWNLQRQIHHSSGAITFIELDISSAKNTAAGRAPWYDVIWRQETLQSACIGLEPHLAVDLLLGDGPGALAHLLLHLVGGRLVLLLQLLLLLAVAADLAQQAAPDAWVLRSRERKGTSPISCMCSCCEMNRGFQEDRVPLCIGLRLIKAGDDLPDTSCFNVKKGWSIAVWPLKDGVLLPTDMVPGLHG